MLKWLRVQRLIFRLKFLTPLKNDNHHRKWCNTLIELGNLGNRCAVEPILAVNDAGRFYCCDQGYIYAALGKLNDARAFETLIKVIKRKTFSWLTGPDIVVTVCKALASLRDSRAFEPLLQLLEGKYGYGRGGFELGDVYGRDCSEADVNKVRAEAARALGKLGDPRAVDPLIMLLADASPDLRSSVKDALADLGHDKWKTLISDDRDILGQLGKCGDPAALAPLLRVLGDYTARVRVQAAHALGVLGDPRAVDPLIAELADRDANVRKAVATALALLGSCDWQNWVKGDDDDFTRLVASRHPRVVEPFIRMLENNSHYNGGWGSESAFRSWYSVPYDALAKIRDIRAVEPLIYQLKHGCTAYQENAIVVLEKLGDPRAVEPLVAYIDFLASNSHNSEESQLLALRALINIGDHHAAGLIVTFLNCSSGGFRIAIAEALSSLGDKRWISLIKGDDGDWRRLEESGIEDAVRLSRGGRRDGSGLDWMRD